MIVADPHNPKAQEVAAKLQEKLNGRPLPLTVVVGGDGFMLKTVETHGIDHIYFGLNAGHLGFLLNDAEVDNRLVDDLLAERWQVHRFPLVEARVELADGEKRTLRAINDVYLERSSGQAARLNLSINGQHVVEGLVSDGLIFATALGSTAYAYSAGGNPIHPALELLQITPICPHRPRLTPFVLPPSAVATVEVVHHAWRPVRAVADGRACPDVVKVEVGLAPGRKVRFAYLSHHDFTQEMLSKIVRPSVVR